MSAGASALAASTDLQAALRASPSAPAVVACSAPPSMLVHERSCDTCARASIHAPLRSLSPPQRHVRRPGSTLFASTCCAACATKQTKRLWQRIPADLLPREVEVQTCGGAWRGAAHLEEDHHEEFEECRCRRVEPRLQIKAATAEFGSGRINFVHARRCREASIFLLWGSTGACGFSADLTHQQYTSAPWFHVQICNNCNTASLEGPK